MKILQINCVYPGGSTGHIAKEIHRAAVAAGHTSLVLYGRGPKSEAEEASKTCPEWYGKANNLLSRLSGIPYGGCFFSTATLLRRIKKEKPDIVHLHCINGFFVNIYRLVTYLKQHRIKTVLTLHAEFMYTGGCPHAYDCPKFRTGCGHCPDKKGATRSWFFDRTATAYRRMQKAFAGFDELTVVPVSSWVAERSLSSPILQHARHVTVENGIDTNRFAPADTADLRAVLGLPATEKILLHVTAHYTATPGHPKGGAYIAALGKRLQSEDGNTVILVAGPHPSGETDTPGVRLLGPCDIETLSALYSLADCTVITSRRETFSMPVAESLACGTPVVGFEAGGPERIALPAYSRFVPYGDGEALFRAVQDRLATPHDRVACREAAVARYAADRMTKEYLKIYGDMYEEGIHT